jgi:hypothetical protein
MIHLQKTFFQHVVLIGKFLLLFLWMLHCTLCDWHPIWLQWGLNLRY